MLRRVNHLIGFTVRGEDREIGRVHDFYFDDTDWKLHHMVVDTGPLIFGRHVLIAPVALGRPLWDEGVFPVRLRKEQVEQSPEIDLDGPIANRDLGALHHHYGWPATWSEGELLGTTYIGTRPEITPGWESRETHTTPENEPQRPVDRHLRSARDIMGYGIEAIDGDIGHVDDLFIDESGWIIRYLLVDTRDWLPGRGVLIATDWVKRVGWTDNTIQVDLTQEQVEDSPEYDPEPPLARDYEVELYDYYGLPGYWV
jgi:hypothetical protein